MENGGKRRTYTRINMIITSFLPVKEYSKFGDWLKIQDEETRQMYFGVAGNQHVITALMERVLANPDDHYFLVAKDNGRWAGTIHIAVSGKVVEFGVIVDEDLSRHRHCRQYAR